MNNKTLNNRTLCLFICVFFTQISAYSQIRWTVGRKSETDSIPWGYYEKPRVTWGIRAGAAFSTLAGTTGGGLNKIGFSGGLMLDYRFHEHWSFKPELLYSMRGYRKNPNIQANDYTTYQISSDYIELPLLINWHMDKLDRFVLEFGLSNGVLVRYSVLQNGGQVANASRFRPYDLSLAVGMQFQFHPNWQFYFRFSNSLFPVEPTSTDTVIFNPIYGDVRIGLLHIVLGAGIQYRFWKNPYKKPRTHVYREPKKKKQKGNVIDED